MTGRWCSELPRRAAACFVVVAVVVAGATVTAGPVRAQVEGIEVDATTTYRVDPKDGRVHVEVVARLENTQPSQTVGAYIRTPYLDTWGIPAVGRVKNVTARTSAGGALSVDVKKAKFGVNGLVVDLEPNLVHGSPQTITIEFDLPGEKPRSDSVTRVNSGFASWMIFGAGDPGGIDIELDLPKNFELTLSEPVGASKSFSGARQIYRLKGIKTVEQAVMFASISNEAGLATKRVSLPNTDVTVKGWPGDKTWQQFAVNWTKRGLPVLEELIGRDAPEEELNVVESARAYQLGYAGFYDPLLNTVEVGDRLDEAVVLHELSHIWFNHELFVDRWIGEGLAEEFSNRALDELGKKRKDPKKIGTGSVALALNEWPKPAPLDPKSARIADFAYNASYAVVHDLTDEIGMDGMRKVVGAAMDRHIPYQGDTEAEAVHLIRDWRYFYDLTEIIGGSEKVEELFTDHVLTPGQAALLDDRTAARTALDELTENGDGWTAPLQVREEMAAWRFDEAEDLMAHAGDILGRAHATVEQLAAVDIDAAPHLESEYESAERLEDLDETVGQFETTADDVVAVQERVDRAGPVAKLGLLRTDLGMDGVSDAVENGELDEVPPMLAAASASLDDAASRGMKILAGVVVALLLGVAALLMLRRRRRPAAATADEAPPPPPDDPMV